MKDLANKVAVKVSLEDIFQALSYAALKARAGRIAPNQILRAGDFDLMVTHDENGDGLVVQLILPLADLEDMALSWAGELDSSVQGWNERERREWLDVFFSELARHLVRWQGISMLRGPGENVTMEKAVSR